jgi:hypothetical protein
MFRWSRYVDGSEAAAKFVKLLSRVILTATIGL